MKKVLTVLLAAVMVFALAACGGGEDSSGGSGKVGALYIGNVNDGGFTQSMNEALEASAEANDLELLIKENLGENDAQAIRDAVTNFVDQGCTIIVGCSFGYGEVLNELANSGDYDDITFLHFSGSYQNETNLENFFGSMEEARYLSGMAAASVSETGVLGYVAAFPYTEVQIGINAFTLGAQAVNPDVEVKVIYINTWGDAEIERTGAEQLIAADCDVLTYHADSTATQLAASEAGVYTTGWNVANNVAGDYYITAPYWDIEGYFTSAFEKILNGEFVPSGNQPFSYYGSMADGMICLDELGSAVPEDVAQQINDVKAQMENGEFEVFSGEIRYSDGTLLCEEGQTLTDEEIWQINKEVEGVTSTSN